MQLGGPSGGLPGTADTIPDALRIAAARLGHRPAVTVVRVDRRDEQGFASLARWTAKGAHLLRDEIGASEGDRMRLDAPPGWAPLVACLAAWWTGVTVTSEGDAIVSVTEPGPDGSVAAELPGTVFTVGDAPDGTPTVAGDEEPWPVAAQVFPDSPPPSAAQAETPALVSGDEVLDHAELLASSERWGTDGVLGIGGAPPLAAWAAALVRPLRTGRHTVVLGRDADRQAADAEDVGIWL